MLTAAEIRAFLAITDASEDAYLAILEASCLSDLEAMTGEYYGAEVVMLDVLDVPSASVSRIAPQQLASAPQVVTLSRDPQTLARITKVEERASVADAWGDVPLTSSSLPAFEVNGRSLRRLIGQFPSGSAVVRVTYTAGYANAGVVPASVKGALYDMIQARYLSPKIRRLNGVEEVSVSGVKMRLARDHSGGLQSISSDDPRASYPAFVLNRIDRLRTVYRFAA